MTGGEVARELLALRGMHIDALKRIDQLVTELGKGESAPRTADSERFRGRPLRAKFGGTCAVCGSAIGEGEPILYRGRDRLVAHEDCGDDDGGRRD